MRTFFGIATIVGLAAWVAVLHRRLQSAQMRGDMYRDISARLDRRVAELTTQEH